MSVLAQFPSRVARLFPCARPERGLIVGPPATVPVATTPALPAARASLSWVSLGMSHPHVMHGAKPVWQCGPLIPPDMEWLSATARLCEQGRWGNRNRVSLLSAHQTQIRRSFVRSVLAHA